MTNITKHTYEVYDIVYDTDYYVNENDLDLPSFMTILVPSDVEDVVDYLSNYISDKTGFCIFDFQYELKSTTN
jgi:hypothetical protein